MRLAISLIIFPMLNIYVKCQQFNWEDFTRLLCAANENNMEYIYEKCETVMKDAVSGCFDMCLIKMRNKRSPTTRIDDKYYQFVNCDNYLWGEDCMMQTIKGMEDIIEHQDDLAGPSSNNITPKPGKPSRTTTAPKGKPTKKKNGGTKGKTKLSSSGSNNKKGGKLMLRLSSH